MIEPIKVNDNFEIYRDNHGWICHQKIWGKDKKTQLPKQRIKKAYFPRMDQCLRYIQDIECGNCKTIDEILDLLKRKI